MKRSHLSSLHTLQKPTFANLYVAYVRSAKRSYAASHSQPPNRSTSARAPPPPSTIKPPLPEPGFRTRSKTDDDEEFIPKPLSRPIGMPDPPRPGENSGLDTRSISQRRDDFVNFDKHLARRAKMTKQISKPYFRDWSNLRFHKGKIFKSNERLFRTDVSLWFPNFIGQTLNKDVPKKNSKDGYGGVGRDTSQAMRGKVSVVSLVSNTWASNQVETFCSEEQNPELHEVLRESRDVVQRIWINYEDNSLKWWLLQLFRSNLRRDRTREEQNRYFMVRRGFSDVMKEAIGVLNEKAGFVYLIDPECRIRWAGSAEAEPSERESMVRGLRRLILEARTPPEKRVDEKQLLEDAVADITNDSSVPAGNG